MGQIVQLRKITTFIIIERGSFWSIDLPRVLVWTLIKLSEVAANPILPSQQIHQYSASVSSGTVSLWFLFSHYVFILYIYSISICNYSFCICIFSCSSIRTIIVRELQVLNCEGGFIWNVLKKLFFFKKN